MPVLKEWNGTDWVDVLSVPFNMVTTDTSQTITGSKTFDASNLTLTSVGPATFTVAADSDNANEADTATIRLSQDGGGVVGSVSLNASNNLQIMHEDAYALVFGTNGSARMEIEPDGRVGVSVAAANVRFNVQPSTAAMVGIAVRGYTGQTASLQEWRDVNAAVLSKIRNDGFYFGPGVGDVTDTGPYLSMLTAGLVATNRGGAGIVPFSVRGLSGQTGNLQEWRDVNSTALASISASGQIFEGSNRVYSAANPNLATTVVANTGFGTSAAIGTSTKYAREDHSHGNNPQPVTSITAGTGITVSASTGAVTISASATGSGNAADTEILVYMGAG